MGFFILKLVVTKFSQFRKRLVYLIMDSYRDWAGITDTELKHRKPYLNLMSSEDARTTVRVKALVLKHLRSVLDEKCFIEVETFTLNGSASGANAKPFVTHHNALDTQLALRVAPELYLKRAVVGGLDKVYEIGRCYRNDGLSPRHNPEFTMIEFYQAYSNLDFLIIDSIKMMKHLVSSDVILFPTLKSK